MPIHDWTRVDAGIFHDFHHSWIEEIKRALNRGLLPREYYALAEQITGDFGPDVLTLQRPVYGSLSGESAPTTGGIAVASSPPKARFHARSEIDQYAIVPRRSLSATRSHHRVIAIVEIVSPGNKSSQTALSAFVFKADQALLAGVHLLIVDLFPPSPRDPDGLHRAIWGEGASGRLPFCRTIQRLDMRILRGLPLHPSVSRAGGCRRPIARDAPFSYAGGVRPSATGRHLPLSLGRLPRILARSPHRARAP